MNNINIGGSDEDWQAYWMQRKLDADQKAIFDSIDKSLVPNKNLSTQYNFIEKSNKHLTDSNMGYWYHCWHSVTNGNRLFVLALSSYVHAILPWKLKQHAARGVIRLYENMKQWPHLRKAMYEISRESVQSKK